MEKFRRWRATVAPSVCFQLIVITHGYQQEDKFPSWVHDMAQAINQQLPDPDSPEQVERSVVDLSGKIDPGGSYHFVLFDWAKVSAQPARAIDNKVLKPLHDAILFRLARLRGGRREPVSVHFIGHSRGCYVNANVIKGLAWVEQRGWIGYLHMTTLDPQGMEDGSITSNPGGIVDWADNYFQTTGFDFLTQGDPIAGALNVDLTEIVQAWKGRTITDLVDLPGRMNHSEVHDWYHWMQDWNDSQGGDDPLNGVYRDPAVLRQNGALVAEKENSSYTTRRLLYSRRPLVERFALAEHQPLRLYGSARVRASALELTPSLEWQAGSSFSQTPALGSLIVEFKFKMAEKNSFAAADGLTFAVVDASQIRKVGDAGGYLGYGGLSGFAVAFDTYWNKEHDDGAKPWMKVSLRKNGLATWVSLPDHEVLEPFYSGQWFKVRISYSAFSQGLAVRVYSLGQDKSILIQTELPFDLDLPIAKNIGFTAATGTGAQRHIIDDVLIYLDPERLDDLEIKLLPTPRPIPILPK